MANLLLVIKHIFDSIQGKKSKIEVSLPVSSSISKQSCHPRKENGQQVRVKKNIRKAEFNTMLTILLYSVLLLNFVPTH